MHLRTADAVRDFGLCHVVEEPKRQDGLFTLGQRGDQGLHRVNIEHLIEVVVERAESLSEGLVFVVSTELHVG